MRPGIKKEIYETPLMPADLSIAIENITTNNIAIGAGTGLAGARGLQQQENEGI